MPIYEYECTSCCNAFEVFQRMTEDPLSSCPECSGSVKKLMSKSSFQLKGSGWYADGYSSASCNSPGPATSEKTITKSSDVKTTKSSSPKVEKTVSNSNDASATTKNKKSCPATP